MTGASELAIRHLVDAPGAAALLARWFVQEWAPYYGASGPGDAVADLGAAHSRDTLPLCLVAMDGDELLGTAALKDESLGRELAPGPWLAALLVGEAHRREGVASALIAAIEGEARRLGYAAIYVSTGLPAESMARGGWRPIGEVGSLRGPVTVYRRDLG